MRKYQSVKRYKRGATWGDGETRTCTVCRSEKNHGERKRAKAATVVADSKNLQSGYILPVGYCEEHTPEELS